MTWRVIHADCIQAMRELPEAGVDAIVTDPPYGLEFMGKEWDRLGDVRQPNDPTFHKSGAGPFDRATVRYGYDVPVTAMQAWHAAWAAEALRVLKPGGHLLAFGGTRTYHRLACALEDAGFEIRDCLAWLYGSGFPKSLDVSKAIDKAAGAAREIVEMRGHSPSPGAAFAPGEYQGLNTLPRTAPATPDAERWQGWGTALKPAFEPIVLARKPLSEQNVAANVAKHGTGAINIDGTRIEGPDGDGHWSGDDGSDATSRPGYEGGFTRGGTKAIGRWPANVLLDPEAAEMLDEQSGERLHLAGNKGGSPRDLRSYRAGERGETNRVDEMPASPLDETTGASRFFYTAKTSRAERERGVREYGEVEERPSADRHHYDGLSDPRMDHEQARSNARNHHPTVKPVDLMQWLCRLITPPKGLILDPFLGSGSTGIAALREGFDFIGIEREAEYVEIARARIVGDAPLFNVEEVVAENTSP